MMREKKRMVLVLLATILLAFPVLHFNVWSAEELPPPEGQALLQYITETNPYTGWPMWPGKEQFYQGTEPHGVLLTTYVNPPAEEGIRQGAKEMPYGSIIVKENYTQEKNLETVTVMYKKEGFTPHHGDWFWLKYGPQREIQEEGLVSGCMSCHAKATDSDWLFTRGPGK
jgi:hypothetical protein